MQRDRVLVTTDLSEKSYQVVDKAMGFALNHDMWLEVLHVAEPNIFSFGFKEEASIDSKKEEKLSQFSDKIKNGLGRKIDKLNVTTKLGDVSNTVISYADEKRVELIIIGNSEHKGGIKELVLGSTAKRIIAKSKTSVLVCKNTEAKEYKNIYVPTDFSDQSIKSINYLLEMFPKASFTLEHFIDVPGDVQLSFYNLDANYLVGYTAAATAIAEKNLAEFMTKIVNKNSTKLETKLSTGHINGELVALEAKASSADLVALAADTTTMFSNTFSIMESVNCDTFLYKE